MSTAVLTTKPSPSTFRENSTAGYITFQSYPGQTAIIDGTGLSVSRQTGLINIQDESYLVVSGFEIRNYATSSTANVPIGIYITGSEQEFVRRAD